MRVDVGVMPATRPEAISNFIRLLYEVRGAVNTLVSEYGAVDTALTIIGEEPAPHKQRICIRCAEDNFFSRADELLSLSTIGVLICAVVSFIKF